MAFPRFLVLLIVPLSLFLTISSRSVSTTHKTAVFDVVSSLQRAQNFLSIDPKTLPSLTSQSDSVPGSDSIFLNSSSALSLKLYSRDILFSKKHENYKSLVLSRLERDSARVAAINSRIRIAVEGINKSTLNPVSQDDPRFQTNDLTTPVISGLFIDSNEYLSRIGIGTPPQEMYVEIDTGSDINWIQCKSCSPCFEQFDPLFDPTLSSTYSSLTCSDPLCKSLTDPSCDDESNKCQYQASYGDDSSSTGDYVTETMSFGESGASEQLPAIALGCGLKNGGLLVAAAGILGLGSGASSLTSQLQATSFSYCLVARDLRDSSTLDFNLSITSEDTTTPLLQNGLIPTYYYIALSGISVNDDDPIPINLDPSEGGGVIMDSGTMLTRLQTQVYNSFRDSFIKHATNLKQVTSPDVAFDTCFDLSSDPDETPVPTVTFHFIEEKTLPLLPENFLIRINDDAVYCFAFAPAKTPLSIIGNVQQQGTRFTFDLENKVLGFLPLDYKCS